MPRIEWKLDGNTVIVLLVTAGSLAVQWGIYSTRLGSLETQVNKATAATEQLTTAVTRIQTQLEERERISEIRRK